MPATIATLTGQTVTLGDETLTELRLGFHGRLLTPRDTGYEQARIVQNGMFDRRPGLIVECSGLADVIDAVKLARSHDLLVAVRGGGHSIAGHGSCDAGLMIDLSRMRGVWVDLTARTVRVQGGTTWGDVDRESQLFGLAVPGGVVSTTGVAGLTLGGGLGWLHRKYGLSCDSLRAADVVTADGDLLRASAEEHPDLFWALRGGGGNFGVVTALEFDAYPVGPIVMNAAAIYDVADATTVFRAWRDWSATVSDEITTRTVFWSMPADPHLPPAVHDKDVLIVGAVYAGPVDEGEEVTAPVRHFATPLADLSAPTPYRMVQSLFDPFFPKGELRSYWKSTFVGEFGDEVADVVIKRGAKRPDPLTLVHTPMMGGAVARVPAQATAFGDRSGAYMVSVDGNWANAAADTENKAWVRGVIGEIADLPASAGTYLNFSGDADIDDAQRQAAYGANLDRLKQVKRRYDPHNRFRLNNNIPPD